MITRRFLLTIRNISNKVVEKIKTHFVFNTSPPPKKFLQFIRWRNNVEPDRQQMTIKYGLCPFYAG
jgi:hypothetical protein